jgi:hypothetical protein
MNISISRQGRLIRTPAARRLWGATADIPVRVVILAVALCGIAVRAMGDVPAPCPITAGTLPNGNNNWVITAVAPGPSTSMYCGVCFDDVAGGTEGLNGAFVLPPGPPACTAPVANLGAASDGTAAGGTHDGVWAGWTTNCIKGGDTIEVFHKGNAGLPAVINVTKWLTCGTVTTVTAGTAARSPSSDVPMPWWAYLALGLFALLAVWRSSGLKNALRQGQVH